MEIDYTPLFAVITAGIVAVFPIAVFLALAKRLLGMVLNAVTRGRVAL